jgi:hypothetical protein
MLFGVARVKSGTSPTFNTIGQVFLNSKLPMACQAECQNSTVGVRRLCLVEFQNVPQQSLAALVSIEAL